MRTNANCRPLLGDSRLLPITVRHHRSIAGASRLALLDRDGVLIRNRSPYVRTVQDIEVLDAARDGLALLADAGIPVAIVTNQACIGKRILTVEQAITIHEQVLMALGRAARTIVASYICPHKALDGCFCRKPAPGMVRAALTELSVPARNAFLVGDALTDVRAAREAGVRAYLVRTGNADDEEIALARDYCTIAAGLSGVAQAELRDAGTP